MKFRCSSCLLLRRYNAQCMHYYSLFGIETSKTKTQTKILSIGGWSSMTVALCYLRRHSHKAYTQLFTMPSSLSLCFHCQLRGGRPRRLEPFLYRCSSGIYSPFVNILLHSCTILVRCMHRLHSTCWHARNVCQLFQWNAAIFFKTANWRSKQHWRIELERVGLFLQTLSSGVDPI